MLELELKDKSEIPEGFEGAYAEKDGVFKLKLNTEVVPKEQLKEFRQNNIDLQKKTADLEKGMKKFQGVDPEKYAAYQLKIQALEDQQLLDAGEVDKLVNKRVERMKADYEGQTTVQAATIEELQTKNTAISGQLESILIDSQIQQAVNEVAAPRAGAMTDILGRGRKLFKLQDGKPVPVGPDGKPVYGKDGKAPMTFVEWTEGLLRDASYLFEPNSGGGGHGGRGGQGGAEKTIEGGDPVQFGLNLEGIASGKVQVQT